MKRGVIDWIIPFVRSYADYEGVIVNRAWLGDLELRMHLETPLDRSSDEAMAASLLKRMDDDDAFALDVLDYALRHLSDVYPDWPSNRAEDATRLERLLTLAGSAWEVSPAGDEDNYALTRRALGPVVEAIEDLRSSSERAADHLGAAWRQLAGRDPNPDMAYFQAVLAVEAAAKPIVSPKDSNATLGKMRAAIRDAPSKWEFALGEPEDVIALISLLWDAHRRHGTDDREAPLGMSRGGGDSRCASSAHPCALVRWRLL